jgi:hypothetical protein
MGYNIPESETAGAIWAELKRWTDRLRPAVQGAVAELGAEPVARASGVSPDAITELLREEGVLSRIELSKLDRWLVMRAAEDGAAEAGSPREEPAAYGSRDARWHLARIAELDGSEAVRILARESVAAVYRAEAALELARSNSQAERASADRQRYVTAAGDADMAALLGSWEPGEARKIAHEWRKFLDWQREQEDQQKRAG